MPATYYEILHLTVEANDRSIDAAYRELVQLPEFQSEIKQIEQAHRTLCDPKLKEAYDLTIKKPEIGQRESDYIYLRKLGEGGFGTTYLARHTITGMYVCIKHCKNVSDDDGLVKEAQSIWELSHQCIAFMRDMFRCKDGKLALVMQFIPGPTLQKVIEKTYAQTKTGIDPCALAWITERILYGLKFLTYFGRVIHGDLKPGNIIVQWQTHDSVLIDFGLAMVKPTGVSRSRGYTEFFSPPEAMIGSSQTPESDLYSLGKTMLYALCGNYDDAERLNFPKGTPRALALFILRLINENIKERPRWKRGPSDTEGEDLVDEFVKVRMDSFGSRWSPVKPLVF